MILRLSPDTPVQLLDAYKSLSGTFIIPQLEDILLVNSSSINTVPTDLASYVIESIVFEDDMQLSSNVFNPETEINLGKTVINSKSTFVCAGPCSVESEEQINQVAEYVKTSGLSFIRGGCYKPRTSPYSFQGLELEGLKLLRRAADKHGLKVITEAKDSSHIEDVVEFADVIQIGTKAMYDQSLLTAVGRQSKPVLLKRGFATTIQEFLQGTEFIMSQGNFNVMLCERGMRTFENKTRFTLDLTAVAWLKERTHLPIVVDPSHAMGQRAGIRSLTRAAMAMGIEGILIEVHPNPKEAKSDAAQQLHFEEFDQVLEDICKLGKVLGRNVI